MSSAIPDRTLDLAMRLPWPANRLAFAVLRRVYQRRGRQTGELTRIRFNSVEIEAPLAHPAVYWRYRPPGANLNFLRLARMTTARREGLVVDVGANIGDGVALLRGHGVDAPILAVEGAPEFAELMRRNVARLADIEIAVCLLAERPGGDLSLATADGSGTAVEGVAAVPVATIDQLCDDHDVRRIALLKTDTDGFDAKVLRGAQRTLAALGPVLFFECDETYLRRNGDSAAGLLEFLADQDYAWIAAWDNDGRWVGRRPISAGVADWIATYPGGPDTPFVDIAAFKAADKDLFEDLVAAEMPQG